MQTKYASSQGKASHLLWTSLKPSHQWLSWGDWHCRCFWRRTAGNCTWEPGCTGRCWAGCGWMFFLNEQRAEAATVRRTKDTEKWCHLPVTDQHKVCSRCRAASDQRLRDLSHFWLTVDLKLKAERRCREMLSFLCYLFPRVIWICSLKWRENMSGFVEKY